MRWFTIYCLLLLVLPAGCQQSFPPLLDHQPLYKSWPTFKEPSITQRRFKHSDIQPLIAALSGLKGWKVQSEGLSVEGRNIQSIALGTGPVKVLLWSQMHGDEPTATMVLFDFFRFMRASGDGFDSLRQQLLNKLTLVAVPMLNPDGAEKYQRRNALDIDLNRDALDLASPESRILKRLRDQHNPTWAFNLHDQNRYLTVGKDSVSATFSFLATAYNEARSINEVRARAMSLVGVLNQAVQTYLPGHVGRYDDTFEPRAFGDNIQKWGSSLVLIECGGLKGDPEKQKIRRVHFAALISALHAISTGAYQAFDQEDYEKIPMNERYLHDFILRNVQWKTNNQNVQVDIAWQRSEFTEKDGRSFSHRSSIVDFGDLRNYFGYEEFDGKQFELLPGNLAPQIIATASAASTLDEMDLLRKGYTHVRVLESVKKNLPNPLRIHIVADKITNIDNTPRSTGNPSLLLKNGQGQIQYAIVNGFLIPLL